MAASFQDLLRYLEAEEATFQALRCENSDAAAVELLDLDDLSKVSAACQAMNAYVLQSSTLQTLLQRKVEEEANLASENLMVDIGFEEIAALKA
eukprot:s3940_g3.t1